jgi:RNA polymerase sigma-70 factor (ECF subfamily)
MKSECKSAFDIYQEYRDELLKFLLKRTNNQLLAEEIVSQLSIKVYDNCEKLNEVENCRAWLYKVTLNTLNDVYRSGKNKTEIVQCQDETYETSSDTMILVENCLVKLLDKLPDKLREPIILSDFQGLSQKEVAEKLNIGYSATKARIQRGRRTLRELFFECCSDVLD